MRPVTAPSLLMAVSGLASAIAVQNMSLPILPTSSNDTTASTNSMPIEAWADHARQSKYRQAWQQQRAIDTLEALFQGKDDPDRAATTIASLYDPMLKQGFTLSPVFQLWSMICEATRELGGDQKIDIRLIELLNIFSKLPDVTDKTGKAISPGSGVSGVYWKDLPGLAIMFREYAIDVDPGAAELPDEGDWTDAQRAILMNVVTFGALYLTHGQKDLGMSFHAEISFMKGVEESYRRPEQQRRAITNVPPAATWILLAGKKIYELCRNGKLDKGRGFSLERWAWWKMRFGDIGSNLGLPMAVKVIARQAAEEMLAIERGG